MPDMFLGIRRSGYEMEALRDDWDETVAPLIQRMRESVYMSEVRLLVFVTWHLYVWQQYGYKLHNYDDCNKVVWCILSLL